MCTEKPICAPHCLWEVSPMSPLKRFQCSSDWRWPSLVLSSLSLPLSTPLSSLVLYPQVVSQAPQHFRSSEKQATCKGYFAVSLCARSFPFTPAFSGQSQLQAIDFVPFDPRSSDTPLNTPRWLKIQYSLLIKKVQLRKWNTYIIYVGLFITRLQLWKYKNANYIHRPFDHDTAVEE